MVIGVTGGVGSGKSTVLQILKDEYDAHIIIADDISREQMEPGGEAYEAVVREFGRSILEDPGKALSPIVRPRLAEIVFGDERLLEKLNSLTHPLVRKKIRELIREIYAEDEEALIVLESAIFVEGKIIDLVDELWAVLVEKEERIRRLRESRGYSREKALSIMENQMSDQELSALADFVIDNSGTMEETRQQIRRALR